jgi:signal transduction histidine kinase/ActR/RegA family two-component response regulator
VPIRFERELIATHRHLELAAFRVEPVERRQVAVLFQDQTQRRQAEIALRELNETLERRVAAAIMEKKVLADIVEGTDALVQVADFDFHWLAINRAAKDEFERIFGVRPKVGHSMLDSLESQPAQWATVRALWRRALAGEEFTEIQEFGDSKRNRRAYEMKFNTLRDGSGAQIGAYQFAYDVTERLRDQKRLAEATARMHEMAKLETLGQLTGGVAHDFNNLLTPIVGALDMLRRRYGDDNRSARLISGALQGAERATTLVQRLLSFARRQNLQASAVDIGALVGGMRDLIQRSIGPHIEVRLLVRDDLPAAKIDPNQLELAVLNLAVNARDAMAGGGVLTIEVDEGIVEANDKNGLEAGRYVRLRVLDTGVGMDEATLMRAVEPFFTTKGQGKGTGLGLSMVHGLTAQSGGLLRLASKPGQGTTAELLLPTTDAPAEVIEADQVVAAIQHRRATILLVDDEELVRVATARMLREMGHDVIAAETPAAALDHLQSEAPVDLLITDYLMPQMRGSALVIEARRMRANLPAMLITGYANLADGEATGVARLAKPFREADLAREVTELLSGDVVDLAARRSRRSQTSPSSA